MPRRLIFPKKFVHDPMKNLMEGGLADMVQFLERHAPQILCRLIFFYEDTLKQKYTKQRSTILPIYKKELSKKLKLYKKRRWKMFLMVL